MKIHNVVQGSPEWHALRANTRNASEAPAMMGVSTYKTRSQLIREKATGIAEEITPEVQRRFDAGHKVEEAARVLLEEILGEDLYPIVATDDAGYLLASSDGATMDGLTGFEHKLWNAEIAAKVEAGMVPESHAWQLDQQIAVFGFEKVIFVCSDGTLDNFVSCEYRTTPERIERLMAGWRIFDEEVAAYQHVEAKPAVVAAVVEYLPAVTVQVSGSVSVIDNFERFGEALRNFVDNQMVTNPQSDQDFADLEAQIKALKKAEDALDRVEEQAIAQVGPVEAMKRTKDMLYKIARDNRLFAEKLVKSRKEQIKFELIAGATATLADHISSLNAELGGNWMPRPAMPFADAIKGLKTLESMKEKINVALATAKLDADELARTIRKNLSVVDDMTLVPDFAGICTKAPEDFAALIAMRRQQRDESARQRAAMQQAVVIAAPKAIEVEQPKVETTPAAGDKMMKLGEICIRLGFTMTADFLAGLGINPAATEKSAKLYRASDFTRICTLLIRHIDAVANGDVKKAA